LKPAETVIADSEEATTPHTDNPISIKLFAHQPEEAHIHYSKNQ